MRDKKFTLGFTALALSAVLALGGCFGGGNSSSSSSSSQSSSSSSSESSSSTASTLDIKLADIHKAVKDAYGEDYLPSMEIDAAALEERFGVKPDLVKEFIAEGPMMSTHVDTFIAIQAQEGKGKEVEDALKTYHEGQVNDALQYPMNLAKVKSAQVFREGDYVFYVMLGKIDEENGDDESAALEFAKGEVEKGLNAIKTALGLEVPGGPVESSSSTGSSSATSTAK